MTRVSKHIDEALKADLYIADPIGFNPEAGQVKPNYPLELGQVDELARTFTPAPAGPPEEVVP